MGVGGFSGGTWGSFTTNGGGVVNVSVLSSVS